MFGWTRDIISYKLGFFFNGMDLSRVKIIAFPRFDIHPQLSPETWLFISATSVDKFLSRNMVFS